MAAVLDKFANDDVSSIPKLSKVILHDQALSTSVLKVANSAVRSQRKKVTTVSRAAIVLGIQTIKNICLTAKILDGLLKNENVPLSVYDRLMTLMANSFYAGHLARSFVPNHSETLQEEIYLAAMMQQIGETAFWCTGSDISIQLIEKSDLSEEDFQKHCAEKLGIQFKDLSIGLSQRWHLGELVKMSLDRPEKRSLEANIINLSNQLAAISGSSVSDKNKYDKILTNISKLIGISIPKLNAQIAQTRIYASELLSSYGASVLNSYINSSPSKIDLPDSKKSTILALDVNQKTSDKTLLDTIKSLTQLTKDGSRINDFLISTLRSMGSVLKFEQSSFWALSKDKKNLDSRVVFDNHGNVLKLKRKIHIGKSKNLFGYALDNPQPIVIDKVNRNNWEDLIDSDLDKLLARGPICIAAITVGEKILGLLVTQKSTQHESIPEEQYANLCLIVDHLNLCLGMLPKR